MLFGMLEHWPLFLVKIMINIFFDCEFTKLQMPFDSEPNELISIGCICENTDRKFYAEISSYQVEHCSEFVIETVLPLLEGGDYLMDYSMIAKHLRTWIESFDGQVVFWSDTSYFDWQHVEHMFDNLCWPCNLAKKSRRHTRDMDFNIGAEEAFNTFVPKLRRHYALDDAIANKHGFLAKKA